MTSNDDKNLGLFLKANQPIPPQKTVFEMNASIRKTATRLGLDTVSASVPNVSASKKSRRSWPFLPLKSFLGASGFMAAALVAAVVTSRTVSQSPSDAQALAILTGSGEIGDETENDEPALDVGQDWLDLLDQV